jgi:hypothetical protein
MKLADYIKANTTVTAFAQRIGKSRAQVHRYMLGKNLTVDVIELIRHETGGAVSPADFFAAADAPAQTTDAPKRAA